MLSSNKSDDFCRNFNFINIKFKCVKGFSSEYFTVTQITGSIFVLCGVI